MVGLVDEQSDDKCPFCYKAVHAFPTKKEEPTAEVESKPSQLKCAMLLPRVGGWKHATAKHHLISAMQCYARVRRLVRMASLVGYDVNDPPNGIGLPTVANNIKYSLAGGTLQKFGAFEPQGKKQIAFGVMEQAKAQWHVGHHAFTVEIPDDWAEERNKSDSGHTVSYDESVIKLLLKLMDAWIALPICEEEEDKSSKLKADMDAISAEIRTKLNMFSSANPSASFPFFVSRLAFEFAVDRSPTPSPEETSDDPPSGPSKMRDLSPTDDDPLLEPPKKKAKH